MYQSYLMLNYRKNCKFLLFQRRRLTSLFLPVHIGSIYFSWVLFISLNEGFRWSAQCISNMNIFSILLWYLHCEGERFINSICILLAGEMPWKEINGSGSRERSDRCYKLHERSDYHSIHEVSVPREIKNYKICLK